MKKDKTQKKGTDSTSPAKESKKAELKTINAADATKKAVEEKIRKYIYPADAISLKDKKDFRRKMRAQHAQLTKLIHKLKKSKEPAAEKELQKAEKDFNQFKKDHYTVGALG